MLSLIEFFLTILVSKLHFQVNVMSLWCWNYSSNTEHFLFKHSATICEKGGGVLRVVTKCGRGVEVHRLPWVPVPRLGNGLTLNVDMAGSLLYLSMVWNLDEWLSSWYSSECLLRVCITFWKGRKEGTAKMNQTEKKKSKRMSGPITGRQESGSG